MRRRLREHNIFGMAALDLFASALGAFILITVVLLPYFPNTRDWRELVAELRSSLDAANAEIDAARQQLGQCLVDRERESRQLQSTERALRDCTDTLKKRFVLVLISWATSDDVDLHVVDPGNREFYFKQRAHAGSSARLEEDNRRGPGNEIWLHPAATAGDYRIYYRYYARRTRGVSVRGAVLTPNGRTTLPARVLRAQGDKPLVAVVRVAADGTATVLDP